MSRLQSRYRFDRNVTFRSYAHFQRTFEAYCRENEVKFCRETRKLKSNSFPKCKIGPDTIDRFVYHKLSLKCENHESLSTSDGGPFCKGKITLVYDWKKDRLIVTEFKPHSCHCVTIRRENAHLNEIVRIARKLPNDALDVIENVVKVFDQKWQKSENGLTVRIEHTQTEQEMLDELQTVVSGTIF